MLERSMGGSPPEGMPEGINKGRILEDGWCSRPSGYGFRKCGGGAQQHRRSSDCGRHFQRAFCGADHIFPGR